MTAPHYALNIPVTEYVADPAPGLVGVPSLSASVAHVLLTQSAGHAWHGHPRLNPDAPRDDSAAADLGTIAHALLLEGDASRVVVVDAADWRTKAAQEARDAARAAGKLPILAAKMRDVRAMVAQARVALDSSELAGVLDDGEPELTLLWREREAWVRSRPDWLTTDRKLVLDYKTTGGSAEPSAWARGMLLGQGYDLQAALGRRAVRAAFGIEPTFVFVVQETAAPYAVSLVSLDPAFLAFADAKVDHALTLWRECLASGRWPSYPPRIAYAEPPSWATFAWETRAQVLADSDDGRPLADQLLGGA